MAEMEKNSIKIPAALLHLEHQFECEETGLALVLDPYLQCLILCASYDGCKRTGAGIKSWLTV